MGILDILFMSRKGPRCLQQRPEISVYAIESCYVRSSIRSYFKYIWVYLEQLSTFRNLWNKQVEVMVQEGIWN